MSVALLMLVDVSFASAQAFLDRVVGLTEFAQPLIIKHVDGAAVGALAKMTDVPMGFEGLPLLRKPVSIVATKQTLRNVLDAMVAADGRYEWREDDGVIVVRPVDAWSGGTSLLNNVVDGVSLNDVAATELLGVLTRMVGVTATPSQGVGDTTRFSVDIPRGNTLLQALNAIVRAHGTLTWTIEPPNPRDPAFPITMSLRLGATGVGFGIPTSALKSASRVTCCGRSRTSSATAAPEDYLEPASTLAIP
jgi:hypothetical protein